MLILLLPAVFHSEWPREILVSQEVLKLILSD